MICAVPISPEVALSLGRRIIELIMSTPVIAKVLVSLAFILVLNNIIKRLMLSVAIGALLLGFWSGHSPLGVIEIAWWKVSSLENLLLMLVLLEIIALSNQMSKTGVMKDLVRAVQSKVSPRASMAVLPAAIGLLPMPGGAIFSAPLVDDVDSAKCLDPSLKTRVNYWFRHVWEFWWPLYPGVLLTLTETKLAVWQLAAVQLPLSAVSIAAGYFFLLRKAKCLGSDRHVAGSDDKSILTLLSPILVIVAVYGLLSILLGAVPGMNEDLRRYVPIASGILAAIFWMNWMRPLDKASWKQILLSKRALVLAVLVSVVRIYGAFIKADLPDGTPLVSVMKSELDSVGFPLLAVMMVIPFLCGLATGVSVAMVSASFPIIISLLGPSPGTWTILSTTVLAYGFGYIGMMLSPVHVCLIVTSEHFKTRLMHSLYKLIPPAVALLIILVAYYTLLRWLTPT